MWVPDQRDCLCTGSLRSQCCPQVLSILQSDYTKHTGSPECCHRYHAGLVWIKLGLHWFEPWNSCNLSQQSIGWSQPLSREYKIDQVQKELKWQSRGINGYLPVYINRYHCCYDLQIQFGSTVVWYHKFHISGKLSWIQHKYHVVFWSERVRM